MSYSYYVSPVSPINGDERVPRLEVWDEGLLFILGVLVCSSSPLGRGPGRLVLADFLWQPACPVADLCEKIFQVRLASLVGWSVEFALIKQERALLCRIS